MVEVNEACFLANFFFKLVDGAGGINRLYTAAVGADEVITVLPGDQEGEVGGPFMEAEAPDHAFITEALEKPENGGFVTLFREVPTRAKLGQSHGAIVAR